MIKSYTAQYHSTQYYTQAILKPVYNNNNNIYIFHFIPDLE